MQTQLAFNEGKGDMNRVKVAVVIVSAGSGKRLQNRDKAVLNIGGEPLFYKTLKSLGYNSQNEEFMKEKEQVHTNHKKPLSAQAIKGSGALHEANMFAGGLTPELKKKLQQEMVQAAKAY